MIYKYCFSISGDSFYPTKILDKIQGDFIINSYFKPTDTMPVNKAREYGYGGMSFWHPQKFSTDDEIIPYEKGFIDFIEINYQLFIDNGVNDLEIFIEIYFDGRQCNFEIFDKNALKKISKYNVSLPISIYLLKEEEIQEWENKIKIAWDC